MKKLGLLLLVSFSLLVLSACGAKTVEATPETSSVQSGSLIAEGVLEPVNSLVHSFSVSGEIGEVLVKNGENVKVGQELVRLKDSTAAKLALENAQVEALSAQQTYDQLLTSKELTLAQAQLAVANTKKAYDKIRWNQVRANQARETNEDVINAARAAVTLAEKQVDDAQERYNDFAETADSDPLKAAALSTLSNTKLNLAQAKLNLNYYLNPPDAEELAISDAQVAVAKAEYDEAVRQLEKLQNGADSDELAMAKARLESANAAVVNAQNQLDSLVLKANIAGTVVDLNLQSGQKVAAGEVVVTLADYSNWLIKTDNLTEFEVTSIQTGQVAKVVLDALPEKTFTGEVTYINSLFEEKRGDITYTVTILLKESDPLIRWGMTGAVTFEK